MLHFVQAGRKCYAEKGDHLSSVGAHVRHVIECLEILFNANPKSPIDYSVRPRNKLLEQERDFAIQKLVELKKKLEKKIYLLIL